MELRGAIFRHNKYVYEDGTTGEKFLIILNTPTKEDPILTVLTTSQPKNNPAIPGCIKEKQLFFILPGTEFFDKATWVKLVTLQAHDPLSITKNPDIFKKGNLSQQTLNKIIDCLFDSMEKDIPLIWKKVIRPPLNEALLNLKKKCSTHSNKIN